MLSDAPRDDAIDAHLICARSSLFRSSQVSMEDGHAQLEATQALVHSVLAVVAAVRPTPAAAGAVQRGSNES